MKIKLADNEGLSVVLSSGQAVVLPNAGGNIKTYESTKASLSADGYATKADATLTPIYSQSPTFTEWTVTPSAGASHSGPFVVDWNQIAPDVWGYDLISGNTTIATIENPDDNATNLEFIADGVYIATRTRTDIIGYQLGQQSTKRLASEEEAEALRTAVAGKAAKPSSATLGHLVALDDGGNLTDSGKSPSDFATATQGAKADSPISPLQMELGTNNILSFTATYRSGNTFYFGEFPSEYAFEKEMSGKANASAIAPEFSATSTYDVGDAVMHEGTRYKCTTAVTTAGAWSSVSSSFTAEDVQTAIEAGGGGTDKPTHIWNEAGTDALDDKGRLFTSVIETGGRIEAHIVDNLLHTEQDLVCRLSSINAGAYYYKDANVEGVWHFCIKNNGDFQYSQFTLSPSIPQNINPTDTTQSESIAGTYTGSDSRFVVTATYIPQSSTLATTPYSHLALETVPTRTIAASTAYAVGDLLGDSGKAYRCILAYTSAATPVAPSSDTAYWTEIPVLNAKLDAASAAPAFSSDSSTQYAVGAHCTYNGKLYKCTTETTGGTWAAGSWEEDNIAAILGNIESALDIINNGAQS